MLFAILRKLIIKRNKNPSEFTKTTAVYHMTNKVLCHLNGECGNIQEGTGNAAACNLPQPSLSVAAAKKRKASEEKARRDAHLLRLIDNTSWQETDKFMVEDNMLKQNIGLTQQFFLLIC
jgi:hypothetical protein